MQVPCPHCKRPVQWSADNAYRPFCSERCRLLDLGAWLSEAHAIPGSAPADPAEDRADEEEPGRDP